METETETIARSCHRPAPRLVSLALTSPAKPGAEPCGGCRSNANKDWRCDYETIL